MDSINFEELLNQLETSIVSNGGKQVEVETGIDQCISLKNKAIIKNWLWDVPGFRRWRITRMDAGSKIQVLNSVAYPSYINDKPILGIDILWFGLKKKLVAVLDFQPLIQDENYFLNYYNGLKILKRNFHDLNSNRSFKIYDSNRYFSPWVIFYNGLIDDLSHSLPDVFEQFLNTYWQLEQYKINEYNKIDPNDVKKLQINYDIYSAEKDPAHGLFKSYFGIEWADDFVQTFLFPLSSIHQNK